MSKFFRGDSESESDSQYSESEEEEQVNIEERFAGNRFIYSSSESEEEGKRVVRAEKDKRLDELRGIARGLRNHLKISDWVALQNDFDKLSKAIEKSKNILISIAAANNTNTTTATPSAAASATALANLSASSLTLPLFILQTVHSIDVQQRESFANKDLKKKLSAPNAKALNSMKQKIRKFIATYQTQFDNYIASGAKGEVEEEKEEDVAEAKRKPTKSKKKVVKKKKESSDEESEEDESEESEEDESSSDEDMRKKFTKKPAARRSADSDEESEESEDESEEESDDESSESSTDEEIDLASGNQKMFTREFWIKRKGDTSEEESESEDEEERAMRRRKIREEKQKKNLANEQQNVQRALQQGEAAAEKEREKGAEMSPEQVIRKLRELIAMRGKRGTDKLTLISDLKLLVSKAMEPAPLLKVHTTLASSLFDVVLNKRTAMPTPLWRECLHEVTEILNILQQNPNVRLSEDENVEESVWDDEASDTETVAEDATAPTSTRTTEIEDFTTDASGKYQYIIGNLYSFLQLLFLDYRKSMQSIDFHTEEYIDRLRDEILLDELIQKAQAYYHSIGKTTLEASVAFLRLELVYYKYEPENDILRARLLQRQAENKDEEKAKIEDEAKEQVDVLTFQHKTIGEASNPHVAEIGLTSQLATFLYKHGSDQARVRALLMHVYYLALHNHWTIARDMLLMSHIPETVQHADIKTQVLFNRAMTMLGLAAFRAGEFRHCLENLADLIQSNHIRELLAQGTSQQRWQQERDVEREEAEKKRQLPIHMHINQDHIEAAHLVSAMFAEVPNMALYGQANKKKMISKGFRRLFDGQSRQAFTGPPENTRDLIMAATRALRQGEWERSSELLMRLRMWSVLQPVVAAHVQRLIQIQIKETALETYLISYSPYFSSISATTLTQMFQLSRAQVFKVASTLILQEQLAGSWDQPLEVILMQQTAPSRLQRSALAYSEKVAALVDQNERMLDGRHGYQPFNKGRGPRDDNKKREGGDDHEGRRDDGKHRGYRGWVHRGRSQRFGEDRRRHRG